MSPAAFRSLIKARGYTLAEVADLWGLSKGRISQICSADPRPAHFEFALWALPPKRTAAATFARRRNLLAALTLGQARKRKVDERPAFNKQAHWASVTEPGQQFVCAEEVSDDLPMGVLGTVRSKSGDGGPTTIIEILFETGYLATVSLAELQAPNSPLWSTLKNDTQAEN